jgi:diaminopimelate epimerase
VRFSKWQALGNDYLIVDRAQVSVDLSEAVVARLCDRHVGLGGDGLVEVGPADEPGFAARLRIFNADGSEAELSGNGSRQAILWLHRSGWTDARRFSVQTAAGEIRVEILSPTSCRVDIGRARTASAQYPEGPADGRGRVTSAGREWAFQHVNVGNPQCAIHVPDLDELLALDLHEVGPEIESSELFPERTNVSWWSELEPGWIRARIYERGVGETMSSGTGACGAAVASVLRGGDSPVCVALDGGELEVEVGEDLHVDLTGWALPVYGGELSAELLATLHDLTR